MGGWVCVLPGPNAIQNSRLIFATAHGVQLFGDSDLRGLLVLCRTQGNHCDLPTRTHTPKPTYPPRAQLAHQRREQITFTHPSWGRYHISTNQLTCPPTPPTNPPPHPPTHPPTQPTNQPPARPPNQPTTQPTNQPTKQPTN